MGDPIVDFGATENWALVYNQTKNAIWINSTTYTPIPKFQLPFILNSPYLLVEAANLDAKPWWYLGCRVQQIISVGVAPDTAGTGLIRVPVNRPKLVSFPRYSDDYLLKIEIPPWFEQMKISIWEYTGEIKDTTEELVIERSDVIRVDLTRIETKIDQLL
jgi:hypothetical protein